MAIKKTEDEFIEDLIQPISDIYQETNTKVLSIITSRIKAVGKMTPTDAARLSILLKNADLKEIENTLSEATKVSVEQIDSIVDEAATHNDDLSAELFKARNMPQSTIATDLSLISAADVAKKSMQDNIVNLSNTTGFMLNGKHTSVSKAYNYAVNRAVFETQQGLFDFNTSMRSIVKELAGSGIRTVDFESGYSRRLDSSVRQNLSDGVRQLNANYRKIQGDQFGYDMVLVSWHYLCAEDHQHINGKDYTIEEWEEVSSNLVRQIGTMNCKHFATYGIQGVTQNPYSYDDRMKAIENSNKSVEYSTLQKNSDGKTIKKTIPKYEMTQVLRKTETDIRRLKDARNQFEIMGDNGMVQEYNKKISIKTKYYKQIASETGLQTKMERTRVVK